MTTICIDTMMQNARLHRKLKIGKPSEIEVVLDNCAINQIVISGSMNYNFSNHHHSGEHYPLVVSHGVTAEYHAMIGQNKHIDERIRNMSYFLYAYDAKFVDIEIPKTNELIISLAWQRVIDKSLERNGRKPYGDIGNVDMQLISYALDRAKEEEKTIILSDDFHVIRTVHELSNQGSIETVCELAEKIAPKAFPKMTQSELNRLIGQSYVNMPYRFIGVLSPRRYVEQKEKAKAIKKSA